MIEKIKENKETLDSRLSSMLKKAEAFPDIFKKNAITEVQKIQQEAAKASLEEIEKAVHMTDLEQKKYTFRILSYATNPARWWEINNGKEDKRETGKKFYDELVKKLEKKSGYTPPKDKEAKVLYDITFRLKEMGFDKKSNGNALNFNGDKLNNDMVIAIMFFQKMAGLKRVEWLVWTETFQALNDDNNTRENLIKKIPTTEKKETNKQDQIQELILSLESLIMNGATENSKETMTHMKKALGILGYLDPKDSKKNTYNKAMALFMEDQKLDEKNSRDDIVNALMKKLREKKNDKEKIPSYKTSDEIDIDGEYFPWYGFFLLKSFEKQMNEIDNTVNTAINLKEQQRQLEQELKRLQAEAFLLTNSSDISEENQRKMEDLGKSQKEKNNEIENIKNKRSITIDTINEKINKINKSIKEINETSENTVKKMQMMEDEIEELYNKPLKKLIIQKQETEKNKKETKEIDKRIKELENNKKEKTDEYKLFEQTYFGFKKIIEFQKKLEKMKENLGLLSQKINNFMPKQENQDSTEENNTRLVKKE